MNSDTNIQNSPIQSSGHPVNRVNISNNSLLQDNFGRQINYLRLSVTDRCNLNCHYCKPPGHIVQANNKELSLNRMTSFVKTAVSIGVKKVRLTGGEPLLRHDLLDLISQLSSIPGIEDLSLTTNGILLEKYASQLKESGLHRINVSLDAMGADEFRRTSGGGEVKSVIAGIRSAQKAGLSPVKINCVISNNIHEKNALEVKHFGNAIGCEVRFIKQMNLSKGSFSTVIGGAGGDCPNCTRLRLSHDGWLRPCLFSDIKISLHDLSDEAALRKAIDMKPACGESSQMGMMYNIGG